MYCWFVELLENDLLIGNDIVIGMGLIIFDGEGVFLSLMNIMLNIERVLILVILLF